MANLIQPVQVSSSSSRRMVEDPEGFTEALLERHEMEMNPSRLLLIEQSLSEDCSDITEYTTIHTAYAFDSADQGSCDGDGDIDGGDVEEGMDDISSTTEEEDEEETYVQKHPVVKKMVDPSERLVRLCKYHGLALGAVIGCFIQLSCMGAFFLYTSLNQRAILQITGSRSQMVYFSLFWSAFSSFLGFFIMVLLSKIFERSQTVGQNSINEWLLLRVEVNVATGAVLGVSLTWAAKNFMVGGMMLFWQSVLSGSVALIYTRLAKYIMNRSSAKPSTMQDNDLATPLLDEEEAEEDMVDSAPTNDSAKGFSFFLGTLMGCLIQVSSLAAHYLLLNMYFGVNDSSHHEGDNHNKKMVVVFISVFWDLLTSVMGVAVVPLVRRIVRLMWSAQQGRSPVMASNDELSDDENDFLFQFEAFFSMGALVGVNLSWVITDVILGLHSLIMKSFFTLGASLMWCLIVSPGVRARVAVKDVNKKAIVDEKCASA